MPKDNTIKFQGKTYNLNDIKAGIQKKDLEPYGNNILLSLFDSLDKQDKYGYKNNTLDINETKELIQNLIQAAGNKKLSPKEAEKYLSSLGVKGISINDLMQFLDILSEKSNDIKETTYDSKRNSTVIEYKEGYYDEVLYDGRHAVKAKESKDTSLKSSFELNVPFLFMADRDGTSVIEDPSEEHDFRIDVEEIILKNNIDKSKAKPLYDKRFYPPPVDGMVYFDDNGNEVLKVRYEETLHPELSKFYIDEENKTVIRSIEYKERDNWIKLDISCGQYLDSASVLNNDKSIVLSKTGYSGKSRITQLTYNPEINRSTEIEFDFISGRPKASKELDEKGRGVKVKHFDENGEILYTEVNEYTGDSRNPIKTKKYDKNNQLVEPKDKKKQETIYVSHEEYLKYIQYGENYELFTKLENDVNDQSARELLKTKIEEIKNTKLQPNGKILSLVSDSDKNTFTKLITEMFDECEKSTNLEEIQYTIGLFSEEPRVVVHMLIQKLHNAQPDGTIDQVNYQGPLGDCWFLSATSSIAEIPDGGQEYISSFFEKDENGNIVDKDGNTTVILNGGKIKYTVTKEEREKISSFSIGDPNMRVLEIALDKYAQEFGIDDKNHLNGGNARYAFEIYSGNKAVYAMRQNGKLGVTINDEFIELTAENADRLTEIPISIKNITPRDMKELAKIKNRMAMCCASYYYMDGHALYVKDIKENSVQVKDPSNTGNIATYSMEGFLDTYAWDEKTIFILPGKNNKLQDDKN